MKHARPDYNRIQDPSLANPELLGENSTPIAEDEPVFLLRGKDICAPYAIREWAYKAGLEGAENNIIEAARKQADLIEDWQRDHEKQIPDMP